MNILQMNIHKNRYYKCVFNHVVKAKTLVENNCEGHFFFHKEAEEHCGPQNTVEGRGLEIYYPKY